jgi:hypothetical protein
MTASFDAPTVTDTLAISYDDAAKFFEELNPAELNALQTKIESVAGEVYRSEIILMYRCNRLFDKMTDAEKKAVRADPMGFMINVGASWGFAMVYCEEKFPALYCPPQEITWTTVDPDEEFPPRDEVTEPVAEEPSVPKLALRKDICQQFPVIVDKISSDEVEDIYAVFWRNDKLKPLLKETKMSENALYQKLIKSLNLSSKVGRWVVEPARRENDLCTLVMSAAPATKPAKQFVLPEANVNDDSRPATPALPEAVVATAEEWVTVTTKKPVAVKAAAEPEKKLTRLNQIKEMFPVIWHDVPSNNKKIYAIEIFGKKLREMGGDRAKVTAQLLAALKSSPAWTVQPASSKDEVARIVMNA